MGFAAGLTLGRLVRQGRTWVAHHVPQSKAAGETASGVGERQGLRLARSGRAEGTPDTLLPREAGEARPIVLRAIGLVHKEHVARRHPGEEVGDLEQQRR
ncbi:hypothetical protein GCM10025872_34820 [Barrientosiimonas endolithica]|uniref:Uncharacterized protein n=1 Tax=Barrientosiimonas endolithica TaxID=1535208 RepID=A0ABN6YW06_9MICO|nr:hypothetical protein GCM10025872_34820 [Barrientosiimonas endolithica]